MLIRMYGKDDGLFFDGKKDGFLSLSLNDDDDDDLIFVKTVSTHVRSFQRSGRVGCD